MGLQMKIFLTATVIAFVSGLLRTLSKNETDAGLQTIAWVSALVFNLSLLTMIAVFIWWIWTL
jgi:hypothetical protein